MAHPEDNSGLLNVGDEIRDYEYERGLNVNAGKLAASEAKNSELTIALAAELAKTARLEKQYADHMATHAPQLTLNQKLIGVQIFTDRGHYTNYDRIREHLAYTGFKTARSFLGTGTTQAQIDHMNRLTDELGIDWMLTVGKPMVTLSDADKSEIVDKRSQIKKVRRLCGWNESNNMGSGWVGPTVDHNEWLMDEFGNVDRIGSFQLWAGTMAKHNADLDAIGPAANGSFHDIVWHLYKPGEDRIVDFEARYRRHFGNLPIVCSETGMSTALNQSQGAEKMTPEQQATYLKTHTGLYVKRGYEVYVFESENGPNENTNREDGLGLFFNDGSPKPAATMFREYLPAA